MNFDLKKMFKKIDNTKFYPFCDTFETEIFEKDWKAENKKKLQITFKKAFIKKY